MSQQFAGIPIGKGNVVFIDIILIIIPAFLLGFYAVTTFDLYSFVVAIALFAFLYFNPIRMSAMFPTSFVIILDEG